MNNDGPQQLANLMAAPVVAALKLPMTITNAVLQGGQEVTNQMKNTSAPRQLMLQTAELLKEPLRPLQELPKIFQIPAQGGETYRAPGLPDRVVKPGTAKSGQLTEQPTGRVILTHIF